MKNRRKKKNELLEDENNELLGMHTNGLRSSWTKKEWEPTRWVWKQSGNNLQKNSEEMKIPMPDLLYQFQLQNSLARFSHAHQPLSFTVENNTDRATL